VWDQVWDILNGDDDDLAELEQLIDDLTRSSPT
jgi:hypothetical protein